MIKIEKKREVNQCNTLMLSGENHKTLFINYVLHRECKVCWGKERRLKNFGSCIPSLSLRLFISLPPRLSPPPPPLSLSLPVCVCAVICSVKKKKSEIKLHANNLKRDQNTKVQISFILILYFNKQHIVH